MVEDSTGAHILPPLQISPWQLARSHQLLSMAQVRPLLTPFLSHYLFYDAWDMY